MHGGIKFYRGEPSGARAYVEAGHPGADDYYLAEGTGLGAHYASTPGLGAAGVQRRADLDGVTYERWVYGYDASTGRAKGLISNKEDAVRFLEVVVNGSKTWSMAAAVHPEIIGWVADHSTTRVGSQAVRSRCRSSMGWRPWWCATTRLAPGTPHRHLHLHLQINAKVFAAGKWRALHSLGTRASIEAINGIGHAAVMCDPEFRAVLAAHGYSLDEDGEVRELAPYAGRLSQRSAQIGRNVDRYQAQWRADHPGQEPDSRQRRGWDRRAWADNRPDKIVPRDGADLLARWNDDLHQLGFRTPTAAAQIVQTTIGSIRRDAVVDLILSRLGARRSAWNAADIRGEAEKIIAAVGIVAERAVRTELAEDLTSRAVATCQPLIDRADAPECVRNLTSAQVLAVESNLVDRLVARAAHPAHGNSRVHGIGALDPAQQQVVAALAGDAQLLVIEGAAGTGKTTTLAAARAALELHGRRLVVVTPTLKSAEAAARQVGTNAFSAAWLIDRAGASVALLGDRHQLPAVGRGGVLDRAARWARPEAHLELESAHRFTDPAYVDLNLLMRTGERSGEVFDALLDRGEIAIHASEVERTPVLAAVGAATDQNVIADTREQVSALNTTIRDQRHHAGERPGEPDGERSGERVTRRGERIGLGDRVATRHNDRSIGVANRDTWTVIGTGDDGSLLVTGRAGQRALPDDYVADHVELAFATTLYGAQGDTVDAAHLVIGETTGAAAAYVGMTRGRHHNVAHHVTETIEDARRQWINIASRDRADLGPAHAAALAADEVERYGPQA